MNISILLLVIIAILFASRMRKGLPLSLSRGRLMAVLAAVVLAHITVLGCLVAVYHHKHS